LLSFILSLQGEGDIAFRCAVEGIERGQALHSPFITAVGHMRQGHAWLLQADDRAYDKACRSYREAILLSEDLAVPRLKVEAYLGLCRAHGFQGVIEAAEEAAELGIEIAQRAGDEWIVALISVSLGATYVLAQRLVDGTSWLTQAGIIFRECGDTFGQALVRLWQCLMWAETGDFARLEHGLYDLLSLIREHGYDFLFRRKTLFGPPDVRRLVPLLTFARDAGHQRAYAGSLLAQIGLAGLEMHPGYQLRVQTLGSFCTWRGVEEISPHEWRREKARQLFQLLLTRRREMLDRDQIIEMLWPRLAPDAARRDFKVAMSTLLRVLEPGRGRGTPSAFVLRDGSLYGLRPGTDLWLDADRFERIVDEGDRLFDRNQEAALSYYREALALYKGEYLQECPYDDWCSEERERLLTLYLRTADRLAYGLVQREEWEVAIDVCRAILARDDCWERAYRLVMVAYSRMGNRALALRTYQRCEDCLQAALEIKPSVATVNLYEAILQSESPDTTLV
jgi:DNA-binding SARP family transcriptional activator